MHLFGSSSMHKLFLAGSLPAAEPEPAQRSVSLSPLGSEIDCLDCGACKGPLGQLQRAAGHAAFERTLQQEAEKLSP